jgi:hypothetical protein
VNCTYHGHFKRVLTVVVHLRTVFTVGFIGSRCRDVNDQTRC